MSTQPKKPKAQRSLRSTVIEPFKQVRMGLYMLSLSLSFLVLVAYMIVSAFVDQYRHVMEIFNVVDPETRWELVTNDVFYSNAYKIGVLFLIYIVLSLILVFRMTHKVYGPLVSIERFIEQMGAGHYEKRLVIRKGDDLQRLASQLNKMASMLDRRHGHRRSEFAKTPANDPKKVDSKP